MITYNIVLAPDTDADQSVSCQAQINAIPKGAIICMPVGRYRIDAGLRLRSRQRLKRDS